MPEIKTSIVVLGHNKSSFTKSCLRDLILLDDSHEIIFVDNGSTDDTKKIADEIASEHSKLKVFHLDINSGFAKGCNFGYSKASGEYIIFLNNDIKVKYEFENWTRKLINAASDGSLVSSNGGLLDSDFNFLMETDHFIDSKYFYLSGWCLCGKKETFEKLESSLGPFSEKFFAYFEDTDLSFRAKKLGIILKVIDSLPLIHFKRITGKSLNINELYSKSKKTFEELWS